LDETQKNNKEMNNKEVAIREFEICDAEQLVYIANNKNVEKFLRDSFPSPYTLNDAERYIRICMRQKPASFLAITYKNSYVGNISLLKNIMVFDNSAELGYFIGEPYWNKGIATKGIQLMCEYGFSELEFDVIKAYVFEYNHASMRVLEKNGFVRNSIKKKSIVKNGTNWDEHEFIKHKH